MNGSSAVSEISAVTTDSRSKIENSLFVPLKGEKFDGHDFINKAYENGASIVLSAKELDSSKPYIRVDDTLFALHRLSTEYLKTLNLRRVCITGSTGKTTTKNLLSACIREEGTIATEGNTNNLIGVPQNIFRCGRETKNVILEMGMNMKGELTALSDIVKPTHIIITTVNNSHIGNFASFEEIINAKLEILSGYSNRETPVIVNGDDSHVTERMKGINIVTFGMNGKNDFHPEDITLMKEKSEIKINSKTYSIGIPGMGGVYSFLAVFAFLKTFAEFKSDIEKGLSEFVRPQSRLNIIPLRDITLIDDSYNASPASMQNAIDVLSRFSARRVALLSDMLELGDESKFLHERVGEELNKKSIDVLVAVGKEAKTYYDIFIGEKYYFEERKEMEKKIFSILKSRDAVLVKGSHSTMMNETAKLIKENYNAL